MDIHSRVRASPSPLWHSCLAWFAFALGLAGCGGGGSTDSGPRLERLTEAPTSAGAATTLAGPATTAGQRKFALASQSTFITNPAVASGAFHTLALKNDGTVWAWGFSTDGQLGTNTPSSEVPAQVLGLGGSGVSTDVRAIAAGGFHSLALKRDGTVWAWGFGGEGRLGNNSLLSTATQMQVLDVNGVDKLEGIAAIAAGGFFSLALKRDGSLLAWGQGFAGQLGNNATARSAIPVQVLVSGGDGVFSNVRAIACGLWFALALAGDGSLWSWGCGGQGQLGSNDNVNRSAPQPVLDATGVVSFVDVTAIAARNFHSLAVKSDGTVWAWGLGFNGQLGNNSTASHSLPVQALDVSGANALGDARSVWAGSFHSLARTVDGTARSWGFGASGQLGNNQSRDSALPVRVTDATSIGALDRVFALAGSSNFTVALRGDGSVWAWGSGRLGNGSIGVSLAPTQVVGPSGLGFLNLGLPDEISPVIV